MKFKKTHTHTKKKKQKKKQKKQKKKHHYYFDALKNYEQELTLWKTLLEGISMQS